MATATPPVEAEVISLVGIFYWMIPFVLAIYSGDIRQVHWGAAVLLSSAASEVIKKWTQGLPYICLKRPQGAAGCNAVGNDGDQSGAPGFPSGHVATTAAFWTGAWLLTPPSWRPWAAGAGLAATGLMAWSRLVKRCHTGLQVVAGGMLGVLIAFSLVKKI